MSVGHVPDEHLAVKSVTGRQKKAIIVRKSEVAHFMVVLTQPKDRLLLFKVPDDNVGVLTTLSRGKQLAVVADGEARDHIVVGCQEVLVMWVLDITHHNTTANDKHVLTRTRVQMNRGDDGTREANRMVKFNLAT